MSPTATLNSQPVMTVADEQLATNVLLVEWLVKRLFEKSSISLNVILDFGFWILDWRFTNERIKV